MRENPETVQIIEEARSGNGDAVLELWLKYKAFIYKLAGKEKRHADQAGIGYIVDVDDLAQDAYFALLEAIEKFDESRGSFMQILSYCLKRSFDRTLGVKRRLNDPTRNPLSIDMPLPEARDVLLGDTLVEGSDPYAELVEGDYLRSCVELIRKTVDECIHTEDGRRLMHYMIDHSFECSPVEALHSFKPEEPSKRAYSIYYSGLQKIRQNMSKHDLIRQLYEDHYFPTFGTSRKTWLNHGGTSSVELAVLERERMISKLAQKGEAERQKILKRYGIIIDDVPLPAEK